MGWYTKYFKNNPMRDGAFYFLIVAGFCGYSCESKLRHTRTQSLLLMNVSDIKGREERGS
eukprot:2803502-Rhodomonas_salina.2